MLSGLDIGSSSSNSKPLIALVASPAPVAKAVRAGVARSKLVNGGSKKKRSCCFTHGRGEFLQEVQWPLAKSFQMPDGLQPL